MRKFLFALLALLSFGARASAADLSLPPILVEAISGAPQPLDATLARKTTDALGHVGFEIHPESRNGALRLSGAAIAKKSAGGTIVTLAWTLIDPTGSARSLSVTETAHYQAEQPWDAVDAGTVTRLADKTAFALEALLTGSQLPDGVKLIATTPDWKPSATPSATPGTTRIYLANVTGAPGDGNVTLGRALIQFLVQFDIVLVPAPEPGAYVIAAAVTTKTLSVSEDQVTIDWRLADTAGHELAKITQQNKVPTGSLTPHWGSTAVYAAEGAADGLLSAIGELGPVTPDKPAKKGAAGR